MLNNPIQEMVFGTKPKSIPVWFMRQAGRYLPEYQEIRGKFSFGELCKRVDACCEISLLPKRILDVDAVIVFSDILLPLEPMGFEVHYHEDGPEIGNSVETFDQLRRLRSLTPESDTPVILETLRRLSAILGSHYPLIGFSGAPFTLAAYVIEGKGAKSFSKTKRFLYSNPRLFSGLLRVFSDMVIRYTQAQIDAGANVIQLFDTWGGILDKETYEQIVLPETRRIFGRLKRNKIPLVFYINGGSHLLPLLKGMGASVISIDWRTSVESAKKILGRSIAIQGNLDPEALFLKPGELRKKVDEILKSADSHRFIFNLGHGIVPGTPVENVKRIVAWVKAHQSR